MLTALPLVTSCSSSRAPSLPPCQFAHPHHPNLPESASCRQAAAAALKRTPPRPLHTSSPRHPSTTCRQAADAALKRDLQAWARAHGRAGALACLSNDVGFAAALRHAREASGCKTVAVTDPLFTRPRPSWASPPDYGRCAARALLVVRLFGVRSARSVLPVR